MAPHDTAHLPEDLLDERPSKSQKKRESTALQQLGEKLVALPAGDLARMPLDESLRQAVDEARAIKAHGGRRRQLQYIGKLMRNVDADPIVEAMAALDRGHRYDVAREHALLDLRERLLDDESVVGEILSRYPDADVQQLRQLRRNALVEREAGRAPRAFRELFRMLRRLDEAQAGDLAPPDSPEETP